MAGHRRAVHGRTSTRPPRAVAKHQRRETDLAAKLGAARDANARIAAAADIIRRAVVDMTPEQAEHTAAEVVELARQAIRRAKPANAGKVSR